MGPGVSAVQRASELFSDPAIRAQCRTWHAENVPLLEMIDRLGFSDLVDDGLRTAITGLSEAEVGIIRNAFVAEIDNAGQSTTVEMPVECTLNTVVGPVTVTASQASGRPVAVVT